MKTKTLIILAGLTLAIVATWVAYEFSGGLSYSKETACQSDLYALKTQLELYKQEHGRYPTTKEGVMALTNRPSDTTAPLSFTNLCCLFPLIHGNTHIGTFTQVAGIRRASTYTRLVRMVSKVAMISIHQRIGNRDQASILNRVKGSPSKNACLCYAAFALSTLGLLPRRGAAELSGTNAFKKGGETVPRQNFGLIGRS
jgi:type II secretory pathway pseudopilin PulG